MKLTVAVAVFVLLAGTVLAEEPVSPPRGVEQVWEGYLYRDREKRIQIGWPVVAMGVTDQPDHIVAGDLARRLDPLVSPVKAPYVFWNYDLEHEDAKALAAVPRILVRIRGRVLEEESSELPYGGSRRLEDGALLSVEYLSRDWLLAWARVFRDKRSPFRIDLDRAPLTDRDHRAFAPVALAILVAMRAAPGATEAEIDVVRKIRPEAKVVARFRRQTECGIQRWLTDTSRRLALDLPGLAKLDPLPPSRTEIQRWFLETEDRKAFFARVQKVWTGDLGDLSLVHYVTGGNRTSYTVTALDEVKAWSEETYLRRRRTTREILER